jgi:hypothetical protein
MLSTGWTGKTTVALSGVIPFGPGDWDGIRGRFIMDFAEDARAETQNTLRQRRWPTTRAAKHALHAAG